MNTFKQKMHDLKFAASLAESLGSKEASDGLRQRMQELAREHAEACGVDLVAFDRSMHFNESEVRDMAINLASMYATTRLPTIHKLTGRLLDAMHAHAQVAHAMDVKMGTVDPSGRGMMTLFPSLRDTALFEEERDRLLSDDPIVTELAQLDKVTAMLNKAYPELVGRNDRFTPTSLVMLQLDGGDMSKLTLGLFNLARFCQLPELARTLRDHHVEVREAGRLGSTLAELTGSGLFYRFTPAREKAVSYILLMLDHLIEHGSMDGFDEALVPSKESLQKLVVPELPFNDKDKAIADMDEAALDRAMKMTVAA